MVRWQAGIVEHLARGFTAALWDSAAAADSTRLCVECLRVSCLAGAGGGVASAVSPGKIEHEREVVGREARGGDPSLQLLL